VDEVIRIMRICLVSSCKNSQESSFSAPHRMAKFMSKFASDESSVDLYFENPDTGCFAHVHH
jgi:hypothetical protein